MTQPQELAILTRSKLRDKSVGMAHLRFIWETRTEDVWRTNPELYAILAERALKLGEPFLAYDVARKGLEADDKNIKFHHIMALSLSQSGAPEEANRLLASLHAKGHNDSETLSLLARTHKDLWALNTPDSPLHLQKAYELYRLAFDTTGNYYPGVNAATLALLSGLKEEAVTLAQKVRTICKALYKDDSSYWMDATLGEVSLILGEIESARTYYKKASQEARSDPSSLCSIRKQARKLSQHLFNNRYELDDCFGIGAILVFSGHMIDTPNRYSSRFPASLAESVKIQIRDKVRAMNISFGFASGACGSDILFLEVLRELGIEYHIILPFGDQSFRKTSIAIAPDGDWLERYDKLLPHATSITYLSQDDYSGDGMDFDFANKNILGMGMLRSRILDTELKGLAVWNGDEGDGGGGTADAVHFWRKNDIAYEVVALPSSSVTHVPQDKTHPPFNQHPIRRDIRCVLFSDIVGFSKLKDCEIPLFYKHYLTQAAELLKTTQHRPDIYNTWGDALYLGFNSSTDAGLFAIELRKIFVRTDWLALGFSRKLDIRIGLHAGPVSVYTDPVTNLLSCTGTHVSRGARIEPITEQGQIYVSESFAAISMLEKQPTFSCDYVGEIQLAKNYGTYRIYLLKIL